MKCPKCGKDLNLLTAFYDTPYAGRILITTISCKCGFKHSDVFIGEFKDPVRFTLKVDKNNLFAKVVRSASGTIRIPELGLAMEPGPASQGFITNVEGVLMRFEDVVEMAKRWNSDDEEKVRICEEILAKLKAVREGEDSVTLIVEDPFGNSTIISDVVFMEKLSQEEASKLKTGLTIVDIVGEEELMNLKENVEE